MNTNSSAVIIPAASPATNQAATNSTAGDIRDIKATVEIPSGWFWLWCVLGALGAAVLACLAWRYWQKHRGRPPALEVLVPPHERARRRLLEALRLIGEPLPFCIAISDALRLY